MKKLILFLFSCLCVFASCQKEEEVQDVRYNVQYLFANEDYVISIIFVPFYELHFQTFYKGSIVCNYVNIHPLSFQGDYPNIYFDIEDFSMSCIFESQEHFIGTPNGKLKQNVGYEGYEFELPQKMDFQISSIKLDVNGDGIIDNYPD